MKVVLSLGARHDFVGLSAALKRQARKQFRFLEDDLRHPSLQAKKYDESADIWQARVNKSYRFYFVVIGVTCYVIRITAHPK